MATYKIFASEMGNILLARNGNKICFLALCDDNKKSTDVMINEFAELFPDSVNDENDKKLNEYQQVIKDFINNPSSFKSNLDIDLSGTDFQKRVWQELMKIPVGQTLTYKQLATRLDKPKGYRAVANACAANNVSLLIPCHRVVRSNGDVSGYRWGVARKKMLLANEFMHGQQKAIA